jgi:DNA repair protein RecO (recombination protein O)
VKKVVDGLVLREYPCGDNDRLITVLTAKEGKLQMTVKGVSSSRNYSSSLARLFNYSNFEYYERYGRRFVSGGSVNDSFSPIQRDVEGYALAAYIVQIAAEITGEGVEAEEILRMTLNTLYLIAQKKKPLPHIKAVYELFAAKAAGYEPDLWRCSRCHTEGEGTLWLDVMNGCLQCDRCLRLQGRGQPLPELDAYSARNILIPLDQSALASMRYVLMATANRIFSFSLTEGESLKCFCRATETYLLNHLERGFDSLEFYHAVMSVAEKKEDKTE